MATKVFLHDASSATVSDRSARATVTSMAAPTFVARTWDAAAGVVVSDRAAHSATVRDWRV